MFAVKTGFRNIVLEGDNLFTIQEKKNSLTSSVSGGVIVDDILNVSHL